MERNPKNSEFPYIPEYTGQIKYFGKDNIPLHPDKTSWNFKQKGGAFDDIPIYSVWNYENHQEIAKRIANVEVALLYMWGTYGVAMLIDSPRWQEKGKDASQMLRTELKKGRPIDSPFVPFIYPEDMIDFWDIDRLHPDYQSLQWADKRDALFRSGPVHIIAPVKKHNPHIDESLIRGNDRTTSFYYMPHPAVEKIVGRVRRLVKHSVFAGGSANFHGENPSFTTAELRSNLQAKPEWINNVDFILVDEITEHERIFRSQTQIRLPLRDSDGVCEIVRRGSLDPKTWSKETGQPVKDAAEGVKLASSVTPYSDETNRIIDGKIKKSRELMEKFDKS